MHKTLLWLLLIMAASSWPARSDAASLRLRDTGLYADFDARTIDPGNLAYSPQYPLWSDGATKRRWIHLPPGTAIDASDPNVWSFPAGTKVWKEFSFHGRPVETRLIEHLGGDLWRFSSYAWNADQSDAVLAPETGLRNVVEIVPGTSHDIPSVIDCRACHVNGRTELLGFSALQLSDDRDPNAPHSEALAPGMVTLAALIERGRIRAYPAEWADRPPRITARDPTERAALGYLHANCGNCHNTSSSIEGLGMVLRHDVAPQAAAEPALATTMGRTGRFRIPGAAAAGDTLVVSGDPARSSVFFRMSSRNPLYQMPPLGTKLADADAVALLRRWIAENPAHGR
jgi:hypothetical protein